MYIYFYCYIRSTRVDIPFIFYRLLPKIVLLRIQEAVIALARGQDGDVVLCCISFSQRAEYFLSILSPKQHCTVRIC